MKHKIRAHELRPQVTPQRLPSESRFGTANGSSSVHGERCGEAQREYDAPDGATFNRVVELQGHTGDSYDEAPGRDRPIWVMAQAMRARTHDVIGALVLLNDTRCATEQRWLINTAIECSNYLLKIINNLSDAFRTETEEATLTRAVEDLPGLIDRVMLTVQLAALDKRLVLRVELETSFPTLFVTDGLRLRQILMNLVGNAVKFTAEGQVTLRGWRERDRVCFSVRDTGPGIPLEKRSRLFGALREPDVYYNGSGLGLSIALSLARLLGGDLCLHPTELGTCVQLELPMEGAQMVPTTDRGSIEAPAVLHAQLSAWGYRPMTGKNDLLDSPELAYFPGRLRAILNSDSASDEHVSPTMPLSAWALKILVVDDIASNRDIVCHLLREQGHSTYEACSGEEALTKGRAHVFDLVLMDMRMTGLSGAETLALWRGDGSAMLDPNCPIVALTADAKTGEPELLERSGFNRCLFKPISRKMLASVLEFSADFQIARGIELEPNSNDSGPLLVQDAAWFSRLGKTVRDYCDRLHSSIASSDVAECLATLHALKGLAGQVGLHRVRGSAEFIETMLLQDGSLMPGALETLGPLVDSELRTLGGNLSSQ